MHIDPRGPEIQLDNVEQMSPLDLFSLYITPLHLELMVIRTNYNAENKQTQATEQQSERSDGSDESESELLKEVKPRAWRETSGPEIGTFIGVLLLQRICKLPRTENYWNTREDLNVDLPIHSAMSLVRWQ